MNSGTLRPTFVSWDIGIRPNPDILGHRLHGSRLAAQGHHRAQAQASVDSIRAVGPSRRLNEHQRLRSPLARLRPRPILHGSTSYTQRRESGLELDGALTAFLVKVAVTGLTLAVASVILAIPASAVTANAPIVAMAPTPDG